jgi:hypothetical protein
MSRPDLRLNYSLIPKRERETPVATRTICPSCLRDVPVRNNKIMLHPDCDCTITLVEPNLG